MPRDYADVRQMRLLYLHKLRSDRRKNRPGSSFAPRAADIPEILHRKADKNRRIQNEQNDKQAPDYIIVDSVAGAKHVRQQQQK